MYMIIEQADYRIITQPPIIFKFILISLNKNFIMWSQFYSTCDIWSAAKKSLF